MCGIVAIVGENKSKIPDGLVRSMLLKIEHRGDQDKVASVDAPVPHIHLGCNRLAIVARDNAKQPMSLLDGSISIAFNGEIYNYRDLKKELEGLGDTFFADSDTEVLLHAYKQWGIDMLPRLDGMFAFVIYDKEKDVHFAARDSMGVKPLYKSRNGGLTYYASEIKAFPRNSGEVEEILPGHYEFGKKSGRYFEFRREEMRMTEEEMVERFKKLFERAVAKRVQTDLPVAMIFSGGLDSAAVLGYALRHHPNITAITMGFEGSADLEAAKRFCKERGVKQIIQPLDLEKLKTDLPHIIYHAETIEPVDIIDGVLMSVAYKAAGELGFKIVLTGDGSDEYLAGYDLFKQSSDPEKLMEYRLGNLYRTDLQRLDRCTMRYRLEARSPFMDKALIQFAFNVPMRMKINGDVEKWILREACRSVLPEYLRMRRKVRTPHGTGLFYRLKEYTASLNTKIAREIMERLHIEETESDTKHAVSKYMEFGYPLPKERFKKPGLDFHKDGFFVFEHMSETHPEPKAAQLIHRV